VIAGILAQGLRQYMCKPSSIFQLFNLIKMKTRLLLALLFLSSSLFAQEISDVRNESGWIVVYDSEGDRVSSMSDAFDNKVVAVTGSFFVTDDGSTIRTFDAKCNRLGSMFSSGKKVVGAAGSTFTVDDNGWIRTYDSKCNRLSSFATVNSQEIANVRVENSSIVVYNAQGDKISSMSQSDRKVVGTTGTFFVVQDDSRIETYDANCNRIASMFSSGKIVTGAAGSTFTVEEGSSIVTYDSKCNRIRSRLK
jgi:ribosomal protein L24E